MRSSNRQRGAVIASAASAVFLAIGTAAPAAADTEVPTPDYFTSHFVVHATPGEVVSSDGEPGAGEPGASGTFAFAINSDDEVICYDIELSGVTPPYQSAARTATHIHEAAAGENGPPRLAFPNPAGDGDVLTSTGCMQGPFTTGLTDDEGNDTGEGFSLKEIEANPSWFTADTHTADFVPGAVRGQLTEVTSGTGSLDSGSLGSGSLGSGSLGSGSGSFGSGSGSLGSLGS